MFDQVMTLAMADEMQKLAGASSYLSPGKLLAPTGSARRMLGTHNLGVMRSAAKKARLPKGARSKPGGGLVAGTADDLAERRSHKKVREWLSRGKK